MSVLYNLSIDTAALSRTQGFDRRLKSINKNVMNTKKQSRLVRDEAVEMSEHPKN